MKHLILLFATLLLPITGFALEHETSGTTGGLTWEVAVIPPTSVTLSSTTLTFTTGNLIQLAATVLPENATNKAVTWASS
ncbi:MAG: Ig-like domain-containing protein, partial [Tannerellaceae bacterium]|nr:Ig-like domain-containing protein [Tannerellaceae bacterium]